MEDFSSSSTYYILFNLFHAKLLECLATVENKCIGIEKWNWNMYFSVPFMYETAGGRERQSGDLGWIIINMRTTRAAQSYTLP